MYVCIHVRSICIYIYICIRAFFFLFFFLFYISTKQLSKNHGYVQLGICPADMLALFNFSLEDDLSVSLSVLPVVSGRSLRFVSSSPFFVRTVSIPTFSTDEQTRRLNTESFT